MSYMQYDFSEADKQSINELKLIQCVYNVAHC